MPTNDLDFIPIDREIRLDPERSMVCKFTPEGIIEYINDYYVEITGFEIHDIVGNSIETFKHPELPITIFNYVTDNALKGENINVIIKDQAKDGRFYWYFTDFEFKKDEEGNVISFVNNRRAAPRSVLTEIALFYEKLLKIEKHSGMTIAKNYFEGFNEENGVSFSDFTKRLILNSGNVPKDFVKKPAYTKPVPLANKSFFSKFFE